MCKLNSSSWWAKNVLCAVLARFVCTVVQTAHIHSKIQISRIQMLCQLALFCFPFCFWRFSYISWLLAMYTLDKADWYAVESPKKWASNQTNEFILFPFLLFMANKTNSFVQFLEESMAHPNCFLFYLTFSKTTIHFYWFYTYYKHIH